MLCRCVVLSNYALAETHPEIEAMRFIILFLIDFSVPIVFLHTYCNYKDRFVKNLSSASRVNTLHGTRNKS